MWMECSPAGSFLMSSTIFTPLAAGESVALPTTCPSAFLMLTTSGLPEAWAWALTTPGSRNSRAVAQTSDFTSFLLRADGKGIRCQLGNRRTQFKTQETANGGNSAGVHQ